MIAVLSLLRSRLLLPVFIALGVALLVQVLLVLALTRSTVDGLVTDLERQLGSDSQRLASELEQANKEVSASLGGLSVLSLIHI